MGDSLLRLEATDIYAGYGKIEVLHGASVRAAAGEIVCIIGPNGSGKSTLLKTVFGLIKPTRGTVRFDGKDITRLDPEQKAPLGIAFIPQGRNVFPSLTVRENLEMGGAVLDSEKAVRLAIEEALEAYPLLRRKIRDRAGNLSGGERQILSLARADMVKPGLILMDEPSIGLSPKMIDEVYLKIAEINRRGATFAIVEQNARKALSIAHRGYVLDLGQTRLEDTGAGLLDNEEVKKLYLGG
ncbi:MAG: ABC transporter ATP-binding protein [Pseudomonadota bacterium]|nr:ABC transporter ATP-binding protein [Pseudomonadota bacterium]HNU86354.1 ABC transporter ATP-binding protein [Syntrophales bacterium]HPX02839.1 ABC transporter ATP-binding protein [Syntrophales bacterium]HQC24418.1 ABC transporter ATP-binding protein [Syntrophales bacterium]